jgi:FkbM family methyltransferase
MTGRDLAGNAMPCDLSDFMQKHIAIFGMWEPTLTSYLCSKVQVNGAFLDVGANIGYFSLLASSIFTKVIAFEPSPTVYPVLIKNIERNNRRNIVAHQVAVAPERGMLPLFRSTDTEILSSLLHKPGFEQQAEVQCGPLQDYVSDDDWQQIRFIKIDVEGAEPGVVACMAGAMTMLPDDVEVLIEIDNKIPESTDVFKRMLALSFRAFDLGSAYSIDEYPPPTGGVVS